MKREPAGKREAGGWLGPRPVPDGLRRSRDISGARPAVEVYGWQIRKKPLSIKIPIDIVERMQDDIQYGMEIRKPSDIVGLLVGRLVKGYSSSIVIQDYILTGYISDNDMRGLWNDERLAETIRPWTRPDSPSYVVGFVRSSSIDWPEIEKEDLKSARRLLKRTPNVFLLIRSGSRGSAGRLFLRPSWRAKVDEEYGEFPLNAGILQSQWDATEQRPQEPALHFIPGNPLEGRQHEDPARNVPEIPHIEAVFEPVAESAGPVKAFLEAAKSVRWMKLPAAWKHNLWTKLFGRDAAKPSHVQPIAASAAQEPPQIQPIVDAVVPAPEPVESTAPAAPPLAIVQFPMWTEPAEAMSFPAVESSKNIEPILGVNESFAAWPQLSDPVPYVRKEPTGASEAQAEDSQPDWWNDIFPPEPGDLAQDAPPVEAAGASAVASSSEQAPAAEDIPAPERQSFWSRWFRRPAREEPQQEAYVDEAAGAQWFADDLPAHPWRSHLSVAATWMIAVGVTVWWMEGGTPIRFRPHQFAATPAAVAAPPIGLHVDMDDGLLNIYWDRGSVLAMKSTGGFLTIRDGDLLKEVPLDSEEIRTGHIYYGARSDDLGIRLEVAREDGLLASESVRVVGPPDIAVRPAHKNSR